MRTGRNKKRPLDNATGVPTNFGGGYLTDGRYVTYLLTDGIVRVETPKDLYGVEIRRLKDGRWQLV